MLVYFAMLYYASALASAPGQVQATQTCLPAVLGRISLAKEEAKRRHIREFHVPGCAYNAASGVVPCDPEDMRAWTDVRIHRLHLVPTGYVLSPEVYAVARNIASEASTGSAAEKVAIAEAVRNRALLEGVSWQRITMRDGELFGRQKGRNPAVSTRQDPAWDDIVVADLAVAGATGNFSRGATHYFSPIGMDAIAAKGGSHDRMSVYDSWSKWAAWVGPIPGVNHNRQFLMNAAASPAERRRMEPIGQKALEAKRTPKIARALPCGLELLGADRPVIGVGIALALAISTTALVIVIGRKMG